MEAPAREPQRVLLVRAGGMPFALPLDRLLHVGVLGPLFPVPHPPPGLCGVVVHRGAVLPVFDLARLLGMNDTAAASVAFVRRAGQAVGLRLAAVEGVQLADSRGTPPLDIDGLDLPEPARGTGMPGRPLRFEPDAPPLPPKGLAVVVAGQAFWLGLDRVLEILDAACPVPVPWADLRAPSVLLHRGEAVSVVRLELLMDLPAAPNGPFILCRAGCGTVAFQVDGTLGLTEQGATPALELDALLGRLPGAEAPTPPPPSPPSRADSAAYLAIVLASQLCLLPLGAAGSVASHVRPARLPGAPPGLAGMRAMGRRILPVVDARPMLRLPRDEPVLVDVEVVPRDAPAFVLAAQQIDGVVRVEAARIHPGLALGVAGIVRMGGITAWILDPQSLLPGASA